MTLYLIGTKQMRIRVVDSVENFILLNIKTAKTDIEYMFKSVTKSTYKERRRYQGCGNVFSYHMPCVSWI